MPMVSSRSRRVRAETPAAERLRALLARAYGRHGRRRSLISFSPRRFARVATLESWLRDDFFAQHARLFGNRPFIWQVWDGRKDGFSVLLNYHRLDRPTLEKLTYTYLNDWIERQRARAGRARAPRLASSPPSTSRSKLSRSSTASRRSTSTSAGSRWPSSRSAGSPTSTTASGSTSGRSSTAGILRSKFTINWNKDRGNNPDGTERLNDLHLTLARSGRRGKGREGLDGPTRA